MIWKHFPHYWLFGRGIHKETVTQSFHLFHVILNKLMKINQFSWCLLRCHNTHVKSCFHIRTWNTRNSSCIMVYMKFWFYLYFSCSLHLRRDYLELLFAGHSVPCLHGTRRYDADRHKQNHKLVHGNLAVPIYLRMKQVFIQLTFSIQYFSRHSHWYFE